MLIIWGIAVLMGVLSVVLLLGKGSFLIAGYNTSGKEEKKNIMKKGCAGSRGEAWVLLRLC